MADISGEFSRKLPFSLEAEQSVLGSILIDPACFNETATLLKSEDFYLEEHKQIYLAMQDLYIQSRQIDLVTLIDTLVKRGVYSNEESLSYIKIIAETVPSASNIKDYATIVRNKSMLRKLISVCSEISEEAFSEQEDISMIIDHAEQKIFEIAQGNETGDFSHIRDVLISSYEHLKLVGENNEEAMGIKTGFSAIDNVLIGMGKGDLILVGARPGMGKTSFVMNIATQVAQRTKKAVCIFSLEMSSEQIVSRILSSEALINSRSMRTGILTDEEWKKLADASSMLSECDMMFDDSNGLTITGMKAKLRRVKNLGLVVIDYLQLMQSDKRIENRVLELGDISRNLKIMAKELGVPVIACAQLSRSVEQRGGDKRPMMSDLRDSGAIEQDADVIMFLYRDQYYDKDNPETQNITEVIVSKNRHGSTGTVKLGWFGEYTRFSTLSDLEEGN